MKRRAVFLMALLSIAAPAETARADRYGAPVGQLYLSGAQDHYAPLLELQPFQPVEFYVVVELDYGDIGHPEWNAENGLSAFEVGVEFPSDLIVTQAHPIGPGCLECPWGPRDWFVGLGTVLAADTTPRPLLFFTVLAIDIDVPLPFRLELRPPDPSSFNPPAAGFLDGTITGECSLPDETPAKCFRPFKSTRGMSLVRRVSSESSTWSSLKSRFDD